MDIEEMYLLLLIRLAIYVLDPVTILQKDQVLQLTHSKTMGQPT